MVSGRFFSCVKFLIVCGALSSATTQSLLARLVMKPSLSRAEKNRFTRFTFTLSVCVLLSSIGGGGASEAGGGASGDGASCASRLCARNVWARISGARSVAGISTRESSVAARTKQRISH